MTVLKGLLDERGMTQKGLSDALAVTPMSVSKWVRGTQPLPAPRARAIEVVLELPEGTLTPMQTPERVGTAGYTAWPTVLAWLLADDTRSSHLGDTFEARVRAVADFLGWPLDRVASWAAGSRKADYTAAISLAEWAWRLNPVVFRFETGIVIQESVFVAEAAKAIDRERPGFEEALKILVAAQRAYRDNPYFPAGVGALAKRLDNGRPVPLAVAERADAVGRLLRGEE